MKKLLTNIRQLLQASPPAPGTEAETSDANEGLYILVYDTLEFYASLDKMALDAEPWQLGECLAVGSDGTIYTGSTLENGHITFSSTGVINPLLFGVLLDQTLIDIGYTRSQVDEMTLEDEYAAARKHLS